MIYSYGNRIELNDIRPGFSVYRGAAGYDGDLPEEEIRQYLSENEL